MLKFDGLQQICDRIELISNKIHLLLLKGEKMDIADSENIFQLYVERSDLLNVLENELRISNENAEIIINFFNKLKEIDEKNINLLKNNIAILSNKLKEINKNKSLMIYTQRK